MRYYVYHFMSGLYFYKFAQTRFDNNQPNQPYPVYSKCGVPIDSAYDARVIVEELQAYGHHCIIEGTEE